MNRSISNGPAQCHHSPGEVRSIMRKRGLGRCPRCGTRLASPVGSYPCRGCRDPALTAMRDRIKEVRNDAR